MKAREVIITQKKIRFLCLLLACLMCASSLLFLVSCAEQPGAVPGDETGDRTSHGPSRPNKGTYLAAKRKLASDTLITLELNNVDLDKVDPEGIDPDSETFRFERMYWLWISSMVSFDYESHFPLFQPEFVKSEFLARLSGKNLSYEQAIDRINQAIRASMCFKEIRVTFTPGTVQEEDVASFRANEEDVFSCVGLDVQKVDRLITYTVDDLQATVDGAFQVDPEDLKYSFSSVQMYRYDGAWYIVQNEMEDDASVDLAQADPDDMNGHIYGRREATLQIEKLENGYLFFSAQNLYLDPIPEGAVLSEGDFVKVEYRRCLLL